MTTMPDYHLAQLFRDYLSTAASITAGLPSLAILPRLVMDSSTEPQLPSLVVAAKEEGSVGSRRTIDLSFLLLTWLKAADEDAAPVAKQTSREQASEWLRLIDDRLRDVDAFNAFLAARTDLEGWVILKILHRGAAEPMRNRDKRTVFYALQVRVSLAVSRQV